MKTRDAIDDFLAQRRIAFVGLSTNPKSFSHMVYAELLKRDYEVIPVNPKADQLDGKLCYWSVRDIPGVVDGALVMTPSSASARVVRDCIDAGIERVWLHQGAGGEGAVSDAAVTLCERNDITVIAGQCPLMFLHRTAWFHKVHAFGKRIAGTYPA